MTLAIDASIGMVGDITLAGGLGTMPSTLTKVGGDTLTLDGANSGFTGNVLVGSGTLPAGQLRGAELGQHHRRGQRLAPCST